MKYLIITIFSILVFLSCKQHLNNSKKENIEPQLSTKNSNLPTSNKIKTDTTTTKKKAIKEWTFNNQKIYLFPSEKTDDFYNYGYIKIKNHESGKFIRIAKEDSPYSGFEKIAIKYPYFTIEQAYREGDFTNYEYITFKQEGQSIYLHKYAVNYTSTQDLEENIPELRLDRKTIGNIEIQNITSDLLYSLRSKN
ncbi:hypothetical protein [Chryseobacterium sp. SIMBA_028]|uniref:hypothetical protein n=2 Tax=unclassified Chryseobacterium TaxID=2593645 RepID=UPI00397912CA